jgi:hypothetical protein
VKAGPTFTAVLGASSIVQWPDPARYLGTSETLIDRVLDAVLGLPEPSACTSAVKSRARWTPKAWGGGASRAEMLAQPQSPQALAH